MFMSHVNKSWYKDVCGLCSTQDCPVGLCNRLTLPGCGLGIRGAGCGDRSSGTLGVKPPVHFDETCTLHIFIVTSEKHCCLTGMTFQTINHNV